MPAPLQRLRTLLIELRRRKVVRAVFAYVVTTAGLISFSGDLTQALGLPEGTPMYIVIASLIGLPIVIVVTWLFEVVPDSRGIAQVADSAPEQSMATTQPALAAEPNVLREPLPTPGTPFIGRRRELRELVDLLSEPTTRLVTVIGPGGIGKTRLALNAAEMVAGAFEHGVCYVALSGLSTPTLLAPAIAESLGITLSRRDDAVAEIVDYLREKKMLLVLDNFDELTANAGLLSSILEAAPGVRMIATSRERLNLQAEALLALQGLQVDGDGELDADAVQLFLSAALRQDRHFTLDGTNRDHVQRICALVDGMPLAVELAAAWVRVLSCEEIHADLARNFDILSSTSPDVPTRHRSLRAAFDGSWRMLSPEEQLVVTSLAVIRSDFDRETALAIAYAEAPVLRHLLDKSFLTRAGGQFLMLDVVRQYALERLQENAPAAADVRRRHMSYFMQLLAELDHAATRWDPKAFARIAEDIDDVRAAWRYATEQQDAEVLLRGANTLFHFYDARGWAQEGSEAFARAARGLMQNYAASEKGATRRNAHARLTLRCGALLNRLARYAEAEPVLRRGLEEARAIGNIAETVFGLHRLGSTQLSVGSYEQAESLFQEASALAAEMQSRYNMGWSRAYLGNVELARGQYDAAAQLYTEALELLREEDDRNGTWVTTNNLGAIAGMRAQHQEAQRRFAEALSVQRELGNQYSIAMLLHNVGCAASVAGDYEAARGYLEESVAMSERMGYQGMVSLSLAALSDVLVHLGAAEAARITVERALRTAVALQKYPTAIEAMLSLARLHVHDGDAVGAARVATVIATHAATEASTRQRAVELLKELHVTAVPPTEPVDLAAFVHNILDGPRVHSFDAASADATGFAGRRAH